MAKGSTDVFYDGRVHVRAEPCDACLFSRDRVVPGWRAREIISSTREQEGSAFICHKGQVSDEPTSICATWWERYSADDFIFRLAVAYGVVVFVGGEDMELPDRLPDLETEASDIVIGAIFADLAENPEGHPCRDCGQLAKNHPVVGVLECRDWR